MGGSIGDVTARLTLDGSQFEAGTRKAEEVMTASNRAMKASSRELAAAVALDAKLSGTVVSAESVRILAARMNEKVATRELAQAMRLLTDGYGGDAAAMNRAAAAQQILTAAKLETAAASALEGAAITTSGTRRCRR